MANWDLYDFLAIAMGVGFACGALVIGVVCVRQPGSTRRSTYKKWLVLTLLWAALAPLAYYVTCPVPISLPDAYLLRVRYVGWRHVFIAYCTLFGLVVGGAVSAVVRRKRNQSD